MTKRERFLAFATFEPVDRIPRHASFIPELGERVAAKAGTQDLAGHFDMDLPGGGGLTPPPGFKYPDYAGYHPGKTHGRDGFTIDGNGCGHQQGGFHHFTEYLSPLRNAERFEELEGYPLVSNAGWSDAALVRGVQEAKAKGLAANLWIGHMYENAWQVRGYEPFLEDLLLRREWAELLLDRFCDNNRRAAIAAARAGCDYISTGDDVANQNALMFAPDLWRAVMKPRWAKVIAAARAIKPDLHVWYHSDGNISAILDDLVEIGITILNPVQPECMDPLAIRKRFGQRLAFDGCVGTQTTFPFGTPDDMRRVVRGLAADLRAERGGLMLSPTHVLEPEVPIANIEAFFEACDRASAERCGKGRKIEKNG